MAHTSSRSSHLAQLPLLNQRKRVRAVVADDTPDMQTVTSCALEREGLVEVVGMADNGRMAIALVEAMAPDLAVLDVNMPGMSGFMAAMLIKKTWPDTKVLIISSDDDPDLESCALDSGADDFLWKGNLVTECRERIERMFAQ